MQWDRLEAVAEAADAREAAQARLDAVDQELHEAVRAARRWGHAWSEIGAILGITRQSAQQRFGRQRIDLAADDDEDQAQTVATPVHNPPKKPRSKRKR